MNVCSRPRMDLIRAKVIGWETCCDFVKSLGIDDTIGNELCGGCATWCSVGGQVGLHKKCVDAVSPYFTQLVEVAVCVCEVRGMSLIVVGGCSHRCMLYRLLEWRWN